jgi:hypothetical protein
MQALDRSHPPAKVVNRSGIPEIVGNAKRCQKRLAASFRS